MLPIFIIHSICLAQSMSLDSLVPVPLLPNKLPRPSSPDPQEEAPPKCNNHVPSLADQFKESLPSTTNQPPQPTIDMDLEQPCDLNAQNQIPTRILIRVMVFGLKTGLKQSDCLAEPARHDNHK
jgi:hypothetical protein